MRYIWSRRKFHTICKSTHIFSWLVVGLSGATCSGKSTLAKALSSAFPNAKCLNQDDYYLQETDSRHTWVAELKHINWDVVTAFDMEAFDKAVEGVIKENNNAAVQCLSAKEKTRLSSSASSAKDMESLKVVLKQIKVSWSQKSLLEQLSSHILLWLQVVEGSLTLVKARFSTVLQALGCS